MAALLLAVLPVASARAASTDPAPLTETSEQAIEYPSVAAALTALHAQPNVVFTTENGWVIATDAATLTIWSFAPPGYPAYPAVVKRQVTSQGTGSAIVMSVHGEASKVACDDLVRTFAQMGGFDLPK